MRFPKFRIDFSKLWSAVATVVATGVLTEIAPPQYRSLAAGIGAVVLALHPSPLSPNVGPVEQTPSA